MINKLFTRLRIHLNRILSEGASASAVAGGFALGIFIGFLPIMGFQMIPAVALSIRFKLSKLAAILGVWISNPVTFIPIYFFNYRTGALILGHPGISEPHFISLMEHFSFRIFITVGKTFILPLTIGCIVNGGIAAGISFVLVKQIYRYRHAELMKRTYEDKDMN